MAHLIRRPRSPAVLNPGQPLLPHPAIHFAGPWSRLIDLQVVHDIEPREWAYDVAAPKRRRDERRRVKIPSTFPPLDQAGGRPQAGGWVRCCDGTEPETTCIPIRVYRSLYRAARHVYCSETLHSVACRPDPASKSNHLWLTCGPLDKGACSCSRAPKHDRRRWSCLRVHRVRTRKCFDTPPCELDPPQ